MASVAEEPAKTMRCVLVLIPRETEIITSRRKNTSYRDGWYQVPAGKVEAGEQPSEAAIREGGEEAGVIIKKVRLVGVMHRPKHDESGDRVDFIFLAEKWEGTPHNGEPEKSDEFGWSNVYRLPDKMIPHFKFAIQRWIDCEFYTEVSRNFLTKHGYYE